MRFSLPNNTSYSNINVLYNSSQASNTSLFCRRTEQYSYGFNGKENDNEVKGTGNQQDYGFRIYDPRLGKFLSVDPLSQEYPWNSTYAFAENDVIRCVDLDGAEKNIQNLWLTPQGTVLNPDAPIIELPVAGKRGNGMLIIVTREKIQTGGNFFNTYDEKHDPADDQYYDEVVVTPNFDIVYSAEQLGKGADRIVDNAKGSNKNYGVDEGNAGRVKYTKIIHNINDLLEQVPLLGQGVKIFDGIITGTEIAAEAELGNYNKAATIAVTAVAGPLIQGAAEKALPKPTNFVERATNEAAKQAIDEGVKKVSDKMMEKAEQKDSEPVKP